MKRRWIVQLFDYRNVRRMFYLGYVEVPTRERGREMLRTLRSIGIEGHVHPKVQWERAHR